MNDVVWESVLEVILNPELVTRQVAQRRQSEVQTRATAKTQNDQAKADLKKIETEESRILGAYRTGIITPAQLGRELEQIKQRRNMVHTRLAELSPAADFSTEEVHGLVEDFCRSIAARVESFGDEDKRQLLRTLVTKVVFQGDRAVILGRIPYHPTPASATEGYSANVAESAPAYIPMRLGRIVTRQL